MKRNEGNGRDVGGDSNPSDLVVKKRRKRKREMKRKDEGEMAMPPRSNCCWSRSPSSRDEGRWRGPKTVVKWVVGLRQVGLGFFRKSLERFDTTALNMVPRGASSVTSHCIISVGLHYTKIWSNANDDLDSLSYILVYSVNIGPTQSQVLNLDTPNIFPNPCEL